MKIAAKKLQRGPEKCFVLHIGNKHEAFKHIEKLVDGYKMQEVHDFETGGMKLEDSLDSLIELSHVDAEKCLGQIILADGTNTKKMRN